MSAPQSRIADESFGSLSLGSRLRIYLAVFCIFGAMGSIYCMTMERPVPWYGVVT